MKTIVIDGIDSVGKATQTKLLAKSLREKGLKVKTVSFPRYGEESSYLLNDYLTGKFGNKASSVNPFLASLLFTFDRLDFFLKNDLSEYDVLLCDRYTTSNLIHQASKIKDSKKREEYVKWLTDLEFNRLGFPEPDLVFFLQMPVEESQLLMDGRNQKKDIHETDLEYQKSCQETWPSLASEFGWEIIECDDRGSVRSIEDISQEILQKTLEIIDG